MKRMAGPEVVILRILATGGFRCRIRVESPVLGDEAKRESTMNASVPATIDDYIAAAPSEVQPVLNKIRATIRTAAPRAQETISYRMPAYKSNGEVVYFAAFKSHIGLYPPVQGDAKLMKQVAKYANEKGNLRFPLDEPIPYALIARIVKQRVKLNEAKAKNRSRRSSG
jgi:uncharacterized protein YdhG (YjbR/CyaY superfamily)